MTAPDDTTLVLELKKPSSSLPLLPIPIVAEQVWKDVPEDEVKSYPAEPKDGEPVVGSGPFRFVEGQAGGSTLPVRGQPRLLGWRPAHRRGRVPRLPERGPGHPGADQGRGRLRRGHQRAPGRGARGRDGITAHNGDSPGFDEIAFNVGSIDTKTGEPMGDPNPAVLDPEFRHALGYAIDRDVIVDRAYHGAGEPGHDDHPAGVRRLPLGADRGRGVHLRPRSRRRDARRGRLHRRRRRVPHDAERRRRSARSGSSPARTRTTSLDVMNFVQGVAGATSTSRPRSPPSSRTSSPS